MLPGIVGVRNTALVVGALAGLYTIYQYRAQLLQNKAIPIWLVVALFVWAIFHLIFLSQDQQAQLLELRRIWRYAAIGAIFAFGLGLSLSSFVQGANFNLQNTRFPYWRVIYLGLAAPTIIYLVKYLSTIYAARWGAQLPPYLQIYSESQPYYVPKSDYVAFCLPPLAIALGQIKALVNDRESWRGHQYLLLTIHMSLIVGTIFLFYNQNIKNGIAYAAFCIGFFILLILLQMRTGNWWKKSATIVAALVCLNLALHSHFQKDNTWKTLIVDARIALQIYQHQHWKYAGEKGYPNNGYGDMVSITTFERVAWFRAGLELAAITPFGYGLVEDSFKHMAKLKWPEASPNLSHSHSGWLDLILAVGIPGFLLIVSAILILIRQSLYIRSPWSSMVFWALISLTLLWITTEVSATISFMALVFWISWCSGLNFCVAERVNRFSK